MLGWDADDAKGRLSKRSSVDEDEDCRRSGGSGVAMASAVGWRSAAAGAEAVMANCAWSESVGTGLVVGRGVGEPTRGAARAMAQGLGVAIAGFGPRRDRAAELAVAPDAAQHRLVGDPVRCAAPVNLGVRPPWRLLSCHSLLSSRTPLHSG